ncbi:MAG: hypothetical protein NW220_07895 [Leptolyngbyaceae cyanobacterium bins.349]|nr:hypothetical protein [Leptolyngbyaceae cyanobacterium bins.349]
MCKKCPSQAFQRDLNTHIHVAQQHSVGSRERNRALTQIIRMVLPLLRYNNSAIEADVMQQTLLYLVKNFDQYDVDRGCLVTWLNAYLYFRRCDAYQQTALKQRSEIPLDSTLMDDEKLCSKVIPDLPSRHYGSLQILDRIVNWVKTDPNGTLRQIHISQHPEVNAQTMILLRLPMQEMSWKAIAAKFGLPIPTLSAFYQRKCVPLLREFGQMEGWIEGSLTNRHSAKPHREQRMVEFTGVK